MIDPSTALRIVRSANVSHFLLESYRSTDADNVIGLSQTLGSIPVANYLVFILISSVEIDKLCFNL